MSPLPSGSGKQLRAPPPAARATGGPIPQLGVPILGLQERLEKTQNAVNWPISAAAGQSRLEILKISLCMCRMAKLQEPEHPPSQENRLSVTWLPPSTPLLCGTHFLRPQASPGCSHVPEPRIPDFDSFGCEMLKKKFPSHKLFHHHGLVPHMAEPDVLELISLKSLTKPSAVEIGATMGTVQSPFLSVMLPIAH